MRYGKAAVRLNYAAIIRYMGRSDLTGLHSIACTIPTERAFVLIQGREKRILI